MYEGVGKRQTSTSLMLSALFRQQKMCLLFDQRTTAVLIANSE
jgi:hypothetical protein